MRRRALLLLALLACSRSRRTPAPKPAPPVPPPVTRAAPWPARLTPTGAPDLGPEHYYFISAMTVTPRGLFVVWRDNRDRTSLWAVPPGQPGVPLARQQGFLAFAEPVVTWDGERMLTVGTKPGGFELVTLTPGGTATRAPLVLPAGASPSHVLSAGGIVVVLEDDEPHSLTRASVSLDHGTTFGASTALPLDYAWENRGELTLDGRPHWVTSDTRGIRLWGADRHGQVGVIAVLPESAATDACSISEQPFVAWISKDREVFAASLATAPAARPMADLGGANAVWLACEGAHIVLLLTYRSADRIDSIRLVTSTDAGQHWGSARVLEHASPRRLFGEPPHARVFFNRINHTLLYVDQVGDGFGPVHDTGHDWVPYSAAPGGAADVLVGWREEDWPVGAVPR